MYSPKTASPVWGAGAAASVIADAAKRANSGAWDNLSPGTQRLFRTRGLGRGLGMRSTKMAQRLYEQSIPEAIRHQGEEAALSFLKGRHFSHIKSVSKNPGWAKRPSNIVIEKASKNISRGSRNMTAVEVATAKSATRASAVGATVKGAAKSGVIAATIEAPISGLENFFHWKRGRRSKGQAAKDTAKSMAGAGAVAIGSTAAVAGVKVGAGLIGISPTLGPAGVPLAVAGVGLMVATAANRVFKAAKHDMPLNEYHLFFCRERACRTKYAQHVTNAARGTKSLVTLIDMGSGSRWRIVYHCHWRIHFDIIRPLSFSLNSLELNRGDCCDPILCGQGYRGSIRLGRGAAGSVPYRGSP